MKSKTFKTVVLVFGLALLGSVEASAQSDDRGQKKEPPTFSQLLEEMDANKDGKLAKSEVKGPLKNDFAKIDTDEDGYISEKELENAPKPERK
jgi:Ca2+-binding EF-hand superfamily protein